MRGHLGADAVPAAAQAQLYRDFCETVPRAMVFLHELETITVERTGQAARVFTRTPDGDLVHIDGPGVEESWLLLEDDFAAVADDLRAEHDAIGNRKSRVRVAVLPGRTIRGSLHATLPTQISTGLPLHVDASFFPRLDRKGILTEGFEGEWNRAAIDCAAELVADNLELLARQLGHKRFWRLIRGAYDGRDRARRGSGESLGVFWGAMHRNLEEAEVMWTARGEWAAVGDTVLPGRQQPPELLDLLEALDIHTVADDLRRVVGDMGRAIPTATLTLDLLLDALEAVGLDEGPFRPGELPAGLSARARRNLLIRQLAAFPQQELSAHQSRLRDLAVWHTTRRTYASLRESYLAHRDTIAIFGSVIATSLVDKDGQEAFSAGLLALGDVWDLDSGIKTLASTPDTRPTTRAEALRLLEWLESRREGLTDGHRDTLGEIALLPTSTSIATPNESVIPGGFSDPLAITADVTSDVASRYVELLRRFDVDRLDLADYILHFVPRALDRGLTNEQLLRLLDLLVDQRRTVDANHELKAGLQELEWIPCESEAPCRPDATYFDLPIVREVLGGSVSFVDARITLDSGGADLLRSLGAHEEPAPQDVVDRVLTLTETPPDERSVEAIRRVLHHLQESRSDVTESGPFATLHDHDWLPELGAAAWAKPKDLYFHKLQPLFATTGHFIDLAVTEQERLRSVLGADGFGVRQKPTVSLVVGHVRNLTTRDEPISDPIWKFLNDNAPSTPLAELHEMRCWPTESGGVATANGLFRLGHKLTPYRSVLSARLRGHHNLLDAAGIEPLPGPQDAIDVLLEISEQDRGEPLPRETAQVVRESWRLLSDVDADVDDLDGHRVALGRDGVLYEPVDLLFNNDDAVAKRFGDEVRNRLIPKGDAWRALERAGVESLSARLRSTLVTHGNALEDDYVAERIYQRQRHLARIAAGERGPGNRSWSSREHWLSRRTNGSRSNTTSKTSTLHRPTRRRLRRTTSPMSRVSSSRA
jgi:hypothetical protein